MALAPVVFVGFDDLQILDLTGPWEVFAQATAQLGGTAGYACALVSERGDAIRTTGGLQLATTALPAPAAGIDTLVLPGGDGSRRTDPAGPLVRWIASAAASARRVASVCTGAFLAGYAGLLDGRRVTTHWSRSQLLAERFPTARVDADRMYLRDGSFWSSGGITAGIDLALALVEADHGPEPAQQVARQLVLSWRRPGGQSQYATPTWAPRARTPPVLAAQRLIEDAPEADHRIPVLAGAVGMSERHFGRVFAREVGEPPARYVERTRLIAARNLLEHDSRTIAAIARSCGFGTAETLRRSFLRHVGVSPERYRADFGAHPSTSWESRRDENRDSVVRPGHRAGRDRTL